tara:strand:- start:6 stop:359 length:354 start_codon:yes stop_codon:yes gene_type:complete
MNYKSFLVILLMSFVLSQDSEAVVCDGTCISNEDMIQLAQKIEKLESDISIYTQIMKQDSVTIAKQDSLILVLNQKYDLCDVRLKEVEPKWYENKWLYLLIGAFSVKSIDEAFQKID